MKTITAKKLEEKFNNNEEISDYMDFTNVKKLSSFINEEIEDINIHLSKTIITAMKKKEQTCRL